MPLTGRPSSSTVAQRHTGDTPASMARPDGGGASSVQCIGPWLLYKHGSLVVVDIASMGNDEKWLRYWN